MRLRMILRVKLSSPSLELLALNIQLYIPKQTAAHRDVVLGIPQVEDPKHQLFTNLLVRLGFFDLFLK